MKIYYFTSSMIESDFSNYKKKWFISLNPSGQHFHSNLIRALSSNHRVEVISIVPFSSKYSTVKEIKATDSCDGDIIYHYLPQKHKKLLFIKELKRFQRKKNETGVVITETLNARVLINAIYFAKRNGLKIIGVCTDSPKNISGARLSTSFLSLYYGKRLDGYIALTEGLNAAYNVKGKPYRIINGIINDTKPLKTNNYGKYIFYGGTLMEKYGIYNLIDAFKSLEIPDLKLIICGHHEDKTKLDSMLTERIIYLGNLDYDEVINLEQNAIMCVNPRPLNSLIDEYSFPSKILEYLSSGSLVVSTKHPVLEKAFSHEIIWINNDNAEDISRAILEGLNLSTSKIQEMKTNTKAKLDISYSYSAVKTKVYELIDSVVLK